MNVCPSNLHLPPFVLSFVADLNSALTDDGRVRREGQRLGWGGGGGGGGDRRAR